MSQLTEEQVRHIAKLARLNFSDEEVKKFSKELTQILDYIEVLQEVDTSDVEVTAQITGLTNVSKGDDVKCDGPESKELLGCSPLPIIENQIQTSSAHG